VGPKIIEGFGVGFDHWSSLQFIGFRSIVFTKGLRCVHVDHTTQNSAPEKSPKHVYDGGGDLEEAAAGEVVLGAGLPRGDAERLL
jgi:hypothetical protein